MTLGKFDTPAAARAFVLENTRANAVPLVPELSLYLADEVVPLWHLTEAELEDTDVRNASVWRIIPQG